MLRNSLKNRVDATLMVYQSIIMYHDTFEFKYNPEGGYYDLVIDKKIQQLVDELKELPHDVLIRRV